MAIVLKKGEAERAAGVGQAIGQARLAEQQKQIKMQQAAEDRAMQWELEKAEMRSRQDFEKELRDRQFAIDAEERARQWQIEKMELASRMDFEQQEKERLRKKAIFNSGIESIDSNEGLTDEQKEIAKFQLASRYMDIEEAAPYLGMKPQAKGSELSEYIKSTLGGENQVAQSGQVYVINKKTGVRGIIPAEDLDEALAGDYELLKGQAVPKSEAYQKYQEQYLTEELFPKLSGDISKYSNIFRGRPGRYFSSKETLADMASKYPIAWEQYLANIKNSRTGNK